jgi:hypothetical protein
MKIAMFFQPNGWYTTELYTNQYGVHAGLPMDILHTLTYGLVRAMKLILLAHTKTKPKTQELERRLRDQPGVHDEARRGMAFIPMRVGIEGVGKWGGDDYISLLQHMPFVVGYGTKIIENKSARTAFLTACKHIRVMLLILKLYEPSEADLNVMHAAAKAVGPLIDQASVGLGLDECAKLITTNRPKIHALLHYRYFIRRFGAAHNFDTATFERFMPPTVHEAFAQDANRRDGREVRLALRNDMYDLVRSVMEEKIPDPVPRCLRLFFSTGAPEISSSVGKLLLSKQSSEAALLGAVLFPPPRRRRTKDKNCPEDVGIFSPLSREDVEEMSVYTVLKADHGKEYTSYVASDDYMKTGPRKDYVLVQWHGFEPSPAELVFLFGSQESQPVPPVQGKKYNMFALVRTMSKKLGYQIPGFVGYTLDNPDLVGSYQVIDVASIDGHARMVQDFDAASSSTESSTSLWFDDTRRETVFLP